MLVLTAAALFFSLPVFYTPVFQSFEYKAYDFFSRHLGPDRPPEDIVIIAVDQESIDNMNTEGMVQWPWPRQVYAPILKQLSEADAVFIDIFFTEPSSYGDQDDQLFAEAIRNSGNVYLPVFLTSQKSGLTKEEQAFLREIALPAGGPSGMKFSSAVLPVDPMRTACRGAGNVALGPDGDGVYRRVSLFSRVGELTIPNFISGYLLDSGAAVIKENILYDGVSEIPLCDSLLLLRFGRKPFLTIPAVDIIKAYNDDRGSKTPLYPRDFFRGKKVFLGLTAAGLYDLKPTAVSAIATGVEIHATALGNILSRNFMRRVHPGYAIFFAAFLSISVSYVVLRFHSLYITLPALGGAFILSLLLPLLLFIQARYMQILLPPLALLSGFMLSAAYSYATEGRQRRFVKRAFSQYMDRQLVEFVLKNPALIKPGGRRQRATVFFADIAGFTTIAEKVPAEETAMMLHRVLNEFTEVIIKNRGVIDKYIGDCVMAFWGAPVGSEEDESNACRSALQCLRALDMINRDFRKEGLPEISVRIGIHSGEVIAGNLGSDRLFDFTVVGDPVNTASRLESANKFFGTKVMISGETLKKTGDAFAVRELGLIEVKGKTEPVRIYELLCLRGEENPLTEDCSVFFETGLKAFRARQLKEAVLMFDSVLRLRPDDGPALFYKDRLATLMADPNLTAGFDTIKMKEK